MVIIISSEMSNDGSATILKHLKLISYLQTTELPFYWFAQLHFHIQNITNIL